MKNFKKALYFLFAIVLASAAQSCILDGKSIRGSGNVITQTRNVPEEFDRVEVSGGIEAIIEQSPSKSVVVEADDNVQEHIKVTVESGTLKIWSDMNSFTNVTKNVKVQMPNVTAVRASGGARLETANTLRGDNLRVEASSGSEVEVLVEADNVICESSSGSHLVVSGKALSVKTASSSGSSLDASKLLANDVSAESSSGSSTDVHAIVSLSAKASSGSSIDYHGKPKTFQRSESSGGSVSSR